MNELAPFVASVLRDKVTQSLLEENEQLRAKLAVAKSHAKVQYVLEEEDGKATTVVTGMLEHLDGHLDQDAVAVFSSSFCTVCSPKITLSMFLRCKMQMCGVDWTPGALTDDESVHIAAAYIHENEENGAYLYVFFHNFHACIHTMRLILDADVATMQTATGTLGRSLGGKTYFDLDMKKLPRKFDPPLKHVLVWIDLHSVIHRTPLGTHNSSSSNSNSDESSDSN
jgi:hypothetical protein